MRSEDCQCHQSDHQGERVQQVKERPDIVETASIKWVCTARKGCNLGATDDVAEGHPEEQCRQSGTHDDRPVPVLLPAGGVVLAPVFKGHAAQN